MSKQKWQEKKVPVNRLAPGIIVLLKDLESMPRNSLKKRRIESIFPTFMPGKYSQASTRAQSVAKLNPPSRIGKKQVHCICASHASLKYLAGHRKKSNENHYPSDNTDIVVDDRSIPGQAQAKLPYLVVMMTDLKQAQASNLHKGKGYIYKVHKLPCIDSGHT